MTALLRLYVYVAHFAQAKTRAIQLLREVIGSESSGVTHAMLRGRQGPLVPSQRLESLLMSKAAPLQGSQLTCFTSTKVQVLTLEALRARGWAIGRPLYMLPCDPQAVGWNNRCTDADVC